MDITYTKEKLRVRSPIAVFIFSAITFGIYKIYWLATHRGDLKRAGADVPTTWLVIIPIVNIWWIWKFSVGLEKVTNKRISAPVAFILLWLLDCIGPAIVQYEINSTS